MKHNYVRTLVGTLLLLLAYFFVGAFCVQAQGFKEDSGIFRTDLSRPVQVNITTSDVTNNQHTVVPSVASSGSAAENKDFVVFPIAKLYPFAEAPAVSPFRDIASIRIRMFDIEKNNKINNI